MSLQQAGVSDALIKSLVEQGVLLKQISPEFGDEEFQVQWSKIVFSLKHSLGEAELVRDHARDVVDASKLSKVEVMNILLRIGWQPHASSPVREGDNPKRFSLPNLQRGLFYWVCLYRHQFL